MLSTTEEEENMDVKQPKEIKKPKLKTASCKKWHEAHTLKFVKLYEEAECLWDFLHPDYNTRSRREEVYQHIIKEMNLPDFGIFELKNKIKNIRSTYQQEVNKIKNAQGLHEKEPLGNDYKTNLVWFPVAHRFLSTVMNSRKNINSEPEIGDRVASAL